eukprot:GHVN01025103.1.p1 GENE.GHVN01025103.1~~GHVN01025103.1.p1  ORF type:complete len:270 (+),score=43.10 GHVN01025103.1:181-990(+)
MASPDPTPDTSLTADAGTPSVPSAGMPPIQADARDAYKLAQQNQYSLTAAKLNQLGWSNERIMRVFNAFSDSRLCRLKRDVQKKQLIASFRESEVAQKLNKITPDDYKIYCAIEDSDTRGIWTADIRKATTLPAHAIQKGVKLLSDEAQLIKQVKNVHVKNKKMYMLSHLEPCKEVAGGTFYNDGEFDEELVVKLKERASHLLRSGQQSSLEDISIYVKSAGFGRDISTEEIALVLRTLEFEQKLIRSFDEASGRTVYKVSLSVSRLGQ